jgi:hypothetical protein
MSEGCLLWHSRYCGRDTTGVLYKVPLTPSKKRAARLIRQALEINLGRIFTAHPDSGRCGEKKRTVAQPKLSALTVK